MEIRRILNLEEDEKEFSIYLNFPKDNPVYQLYPNTKKPKTGTMQAKYSALQKSFITSVLNSFHLYYIPSNKSIEELYNDFVTPFIRRKVGLVLSQYDNEIKESISTLTDSMNEQLKKSGLSNIYTSMEYPDNNIENFVSSLDLHVRDNNSSSVFLKGMGIQAVVLLSAFRWITEEQKDKHVLWLIEEPETFLHPELAEKCSNLLESLSEMSTLIKTTHALNFIPEDISKVYGVSLGKDTNNTILEFFKTHKDATESIRSALGVRFSDFFGLAKMNIFLEGITDRYYIEKIFLKYNSLLKEKYPLLLSNKLLLKEFSGVTDLKSFLRANYALTNSEVSIVTLFDGDDAGIKAVKELSGFFGKKCGFNSNKDYVIIPNGMAIESLFPDSWINEAYTNNKVWFENEIIDANGNFTYFAIRDQSKKAYQSFIFSRIESEDNYELLTKFDNVFNALEKSLQAQIEK